MAIKEIEQNTDRLSDDIIRLEEEKAVLEKSIDAMFDAVKNLDTMWTDRQTRPSGPSSRPIIRPAWR